MLMRVSVTPLHLDDSPCLHPENRPCPGIKEHRSTCSACSWNCTTATEGMARYLAAEHLASHNLQRPPAWAENAKAHPLIV